MIQEVTHEADEIRRNNTELYDSNRLKQGMGEQARYFTHEQLEDVAGMRKEMESLQLRANNLLTLLKHMFKRQTVHKGKAQQNRRMKENSRRTKKNKESRFKVAAERLLEEITSKKILDTCFPNGMSVKAQSLYQVKLAIISKRSFASVQRKQKKNAAISLVERGTLCPEARKLVEETFQLPQCKAANQEDDLPIPEIDDDVSETVRQISSDDEEDSVFDFIRVFSYNSDGE